MIETADHGLATAIEGVVSAVPGVTTLYPVGGLVSRVLKAGADIVGTAHVSRVQVDHSGNEIGVNIMIGVRGEVGAVVTCQRVHRDVQEFCTTQGFTPVQIRITVAHVDDTVLKTAQ